MRAGDLDWKVTLLDAEREATRATNHGGDDNLESLLDYTESLLM